LILLEYIMNLAIFSLLVSTPLVIGAFTKQKPFKHASIWVGIYAGVVSSILSLLAIQQQGYSYDIRYAPVILIFAYLGPAAGLITGGISLLTRLVTSGHWPAAIMGWTMIMIGFCVIHMFTKRLIAVKKSVVLFGTYLVFYLIIVFIFKIFIDKPVFHFQYILFVLLGLVIGALLIESYVKLFRLNNKLTNMYKLVEESEAKYRLIAENTSDLIIVMNEEQSIIYYSPSHENVLGFQCKELETSLEKCTLIQMMLICLEIR
jgi:PAS domain-containing protein